MGMTWSGRRPPETTETSERAPRRRPPPQSTWTGNPCSQASQAGSSRCTNSAASAEKRYPRTPAVARPSPSLCVKTLRIPGTGSVNRINACRSPMRSTVPVALRTAIVSPSQPSPSESCRVDQSASASPGCEALLSPTVLRQLIEEFVSGPGPTGEGPARVAGSARPTGPGPLVGLTERERQVLVLVAQGWSNAEISTTLYVTPATVKTHVSRLLMKLGARDRAQLIVLSYECGLMPAR